MKIILFFTITLASLTSNTVTIVSFGQSCTVAGAMRENGIRTTAYPFDWMVSPFPSLYQAFNDDFLHFLQEDSLTVRYDRYGILDYYGFQFVHDFPAILPNDSFADLIGENHVTGGILRDNWKDFLPGVQTKYQRRIERLKNLLSSNEKVYLIRHFDITKDQAIQLRDLLHKKYPNLDFVLVVLQRTENIQYDWKLECIKNFYLDEHNPEDWKNLFKTMNT